MCARKGLPWLECLSALMISPLLENMHCSSVLFSLWVQIDHTELTLKLETICCSETPYCMAEFDSRGYFTIYEQQALLHIIISLSSLIRNYKASTFLFESTFVWKGSFPLAFKCPLSLLAGSFSPPQLLSVLPTSSVALCTNVQPPKRTERLAKTSAWLWEKGTAVNQLLRHFQFKVVKQGNIYFTSKEPGF